MDADQLREVMAGQEIRSVTLLGEGLDNAAYEVNGEVVVRYNKDSDVSRRAEDR